MCEAKGGTDLKLCTGCRVYKYCSPACQTAHWKGIHKNDCRQAKTERKFIQDVLGVFEGPLYEEMVRNGGLRQE
jgi:hypothetical protein